MRIFRGSKPNLLHGDNESRLNLLFLNNFLMNYLEYRNTLFLIFKSGSIVEC